MEDTHILEHAPNGFVNITGVANNEVANLKLAQAAVSVKTMAGGPIIVIMSQLANFGVEQTIHSKGQTEHFGVIIDNKLCTGGRNSVLFHLRDAQSLFIM